MWWIHILEKCWNGLRNAMQKYGILPVLLVIVYFAGITILFALMRSHVWFS